MKGYLAPVAAPHIYKHIKPDHHRAIHALVQPWTMAEVARYAGYDESYISHRIGKAIRDALCIEEHSGGSERWRIALTRLYYGVDRCWCQDKGCAA